MNDDGLGFAARPLGSICHPPVTEQPRHLSPRKFTSIHHSPPDASTRDLEESCADERCWLTQTSEIAARILLTRISRRRDRVARRDGRFPVPDEANQISLRTSAEISRRPRTRCRSRWIRGPLAASGRPPQGHQAGSVTNASAALQWPSSRWPFHRRPGSQSRSRGRSARASDRRAGRVTGIGAGETDGHPGRADDALGRVSGYRHARLRGSTPDRGAGRKRARRHQAVGSAARSSTTVRASSLSARGSLFRIGAETMDGNSAPWVQVRGWPQGVNGLTGAV